MITNKLKTILVFLFILFTNLSFSQTLDSIITSNNKFLKKGNFAIVFELGKVINQNSFFESYNFLAKYHISDNMAIRLNFKIGGGDYDENYYSPILNDLSSYDIESSLNIQYYLSRRNFVKPFLSVGPTYSKNHNYRPEKGKAFYWYDDWSLGIMLTLGTEIFIYDNIGIIGEYVIKGSYKKSIYQNYNSYELLESDNKIITFSANTARLGFSVYF